MNRNLLLLRKNKVSIYQTVINILDGRKELADQVDGASFASAQWDARTTEEALELYHILQGIPSQQDFDGLVMTLRKLASNTA